MESLSGIKFPPLTPWLVCSTHLRRAQGGSSRQLSRVLPFGSPVAVRWRRPHVVRDDRGPATSRLRFSFDHLGDDACNLASPWSGSPLPAIPCLERSKRVCHVNRMRSNRSSCRRQGKGAALPLGSGRWSAHAPGRCNAYSELVCVVPTYNSGSPVMGEVRATRWRRSPCL